MRLKSYTVDEAKKQKCHTIGGSLNDSFCRGDKCIMWRENPTRNNEGGCRHLRNNEEEEKL